MARRSTVDLYHPQHGMLARHATLAPGQQASIAILALVGAIPGFVLIWLMSALLFPPALSLAWLVNAGCVALLAWCLRAKRHTNHINLWDIAGVYAFVGFATGMISKPEQVLQLFGLAMPVQ